MKLWPYKLSVHYVFCNSGHMFVWPENMMTRGSDEITSCLLSFVQNCHSHGKNIFIYTDNCAGQNRNLTMTALFMAPVSNGLCEIITQIILPPAQHVFRVIQFRC
jgi:hypothetical protein